MNRPLSVFDRHQLKIARQTLKMTPVMARILGGPSIEESIEIIRRITGKQVKP